jgi:hypothetical protein
LKELRGELEAADARAARLEESLAAGFAERSAMAEQLAAAEVARVAAATEKDRMADQLSQVRCFGFTAGIHHMLSAEIGANPAACRRLMALCTQHGSITVSAGFGQGDIHLYKDWMLHMVHDPQCA